MSDKFESSGSDYDGDIPAPETIQPAIEVVYPVGEETEVPQTKGNLFKTVISEGTGPKPPRGAKVTVHYTGTLASDGSKFDSSRDRGEYFDFTLGQGQVIKGWDQGVATMRKGERANLKCLPEYAYGKNGSPPKIPADATLNFDVELIDWTKSEDVSEKKDRTIMKNITTEGTGWERPDYESHVTCDVKLFAYTGDTEKPEGALLFERADWSITIGETKLPSGLEKALTSMKKGEAASVEVKRSVVTADEPEFGVAKDTALWYVIAVKAFDKVKTWEFKEMAKADEGVKRKNQGNDYFKAGDWANAERKYRRALEFVEYDSSFNEDEAKAAAVKCRTAVFGNLAQVLINQGKFSDALHFCNKCLETDTMNMKARFRRGKCHLATDDWEEAKKDFGFILEHEPGNADAAAALQETNQKIRAYDQKQKSRFGNMFAKLAVMEEKEDAHNPPRSSATASAAEVPAEEEIAPQP